MLCAFDGSKVQLAIKNDQLVGVGHIHYDYETLLTAAVRIYKQVTNKHITNWREFAQINENGNHIRCLIGQDTELITDDQLVVVDVLEPLPNNLCKVLHWLLPVAYYCNMEIPITFTMKGTTNEV